MKKQALMGALAMGALTVGFLGQIDSAEALTFGFNNVTNNNATNVGIGESQLFVDVLETANSSQVLFNFRNVGPAAASIADVYFDDGSLLDIASVINGSGVDFSAGATPGNLPGGNAIDFNTSTPQGFSADSNAPVQPNGVNPGETLGILFNLQGGKTYQDTLNALLLSLASPGVDVLGGLRIGIHVQGFANGGSESFVNTTPIPTPALLPGLIGMGLAALRKKKQAAEVTQEA